jgi:hypothetical protein
MIRRFPLEFTVSEVKSRSFSRLGGIRMTSLPAAGRRRAQNDKRRAGMTP